MTIFKNSPIGLMSKNSRTIKFSELIKTLLLLIFITPVTIKAQDSNPVRFGIKGGINFSDIYVKDVDDTKMRTGFNLGIFLKVPIANIIAIQPELYYTAKGAEISYKNDFIDGTAGFHLNYIELPLMIVGNISKNFNVHAGPYAAYLISGKVKNESNVSLFNFEDNLDTDDYNTFETGVAIGAGVDLNAIGIGLRYIYGLTTIGKERTILGNNYTIPDGTNGVVNLYVSLSLN